ncbi:MAG: PTS sugar transporter subunit IIC [Streptococcaceae bacterium]|jgi:D-glucosaminate-specific PTS system IIC component|nr:PTS sugar transporter subunit IIC [Streptococcaceae bacterium]
MSLGLALTFGILYWIATCKLWYGILHVLRQPLFLAVPIGLIMGDLPKAMMIAAALQLIYLGSIAPGGTLPSDEGLASCIAIPLALAANLEPGIAVTLAVPVGILGVLLDNFKRTYMSYFVHLADKAASERNIKGLQRSVFWYPLFVSIPLRVIPVTLALAFGVDAVTSFLNAIPAWMTTGLATAGGILPALGFAVTIMVIGKVSLIPYFIVGFLMIGYSGMNMIGAAAIGICIAFIQSTFTASGKAAVTVDTSQSDLEAEGDF